MRPKAEFDACCCPDDVLATAQCSVDQLVGMVAMYQAGVLDWSKEQILNVVERTAQYLQGYLNEFAEHHGWPDVQHQVQATEEILKAMAP